MSKLGIQDKMGGHSKQSLRLWLRLLTCVTLVEQRVRTRLREDFSTTLPRFDVLAALERAPQGLRMGELSRFLMVSNGNVTAVVSRLEKDGLISRSATPDDKRVQCVKLTARGRRDFARMAAEHEAWIDALFADLDNEEIAELLELLERTKQSLKHYDPELSR